MPPYLVTAIFSLFGGVLGAICTYVFTRTKTTAEIGKLSAETRKINLESQKLSAEMRQPISNKISNSFIGPDAPTVEVVTKGTREELEYFSGKLSEKSRIILTLALSKGDGYYDQYALRTYIGFLSTYPHFKGVVIVDEAGKFLAYFPRVSMIRLFDYGNQPGELVNSINKGHSSVIPHYPGAVTVSFSRDTTTLEALRTMLHRNLDSAVVVDQQNHLAGIIEREQLIGSAVLALAG